MAIESKMRQPPLASLGQNKDKKKFPIGMAVVLVFLLILAGFGIWFFFFRHSADDILAELQNGPETEVAVGEVYQAVFLDNGQVYFGKLEERDDEFYTLTNIYYLQNRQNPQAGNIESTIADDSVSLIKLGNEMHGPEDKMEINREHILFIEDLKGDSKVTKAIINYLSNKK